MTMGMAAHRRVTCRGAGRDRRGVRQVAGGAHAPAGKTSGTPTATRLEIVGPRAIVPGVPTQFAAAVHMSDGSSRDVTTSSSWRSANVNFVVSAPGF